MSPVAATATGEVTGTITRTDTTPLTADAVAIATLINENTGTLVAREVVPSPADPITFTIQVDPGVIDPAATYVVKAGIVDGETTWEGRDGVPAIADGALVTDITVPVTLVAGRRAVPERQHRARAQRVRGPHRGADRDADAGANPHPAADGHADADPRADGDADRGPTATPTPTPAPTPSPARRRRRPRPSRRRRPRTRASSEAP